MAVVRSLVVGFSRNAKNDLETAHNVVCLSEADLVCDAPPEVAVRKGPSNPLAKFAIGAEAPDPWAAAQSWGATIDPITASEPAWAGLKVDQTLGQLMTETREQRGFSREQVTDQTHIPAHYVRMIESDSYDAIPDELYLLPFIRRYAIFLGFDAQKVVSRFIRDFEKAENEVVETSVPSVTDARTLLIWRWLALAAVIAAVLLPYMGWEIGTVPTTVSHPVDNSSAGAPSMTTITPSTKIRPADAPPLAALQPAQAPIAVTASRPMATTSSRPQLDQEYAQAKPKRRRGRGHRLNRRRRHARQAARRMDR